MNEENLMKLSNDMAELTLSSVMEVLKIADRYGMERDKLVESFGLRILELSGMATFNSFDMSSMEAQDDA